MTKKLTVRGSHDEDGKFLGFIQEGLTINQCYKVNHALEVLSYELRSLGFNIATIQMTITDEETKAEAHAGRNVVAE